MPKRRNKGKNRKERSSQSVGNQQRVEQNVDEGIQGTGGWGVGSVLAGAAGLALSGLQTVSGLNLGQNCTSLLYSLDCDEYNQRRDDCIGEINNSSYNNASCYTTLVEMICQGANATYDMMFLTSGVMDCDELENTATTTTIATTAAQTVGSVVCATGEAVAQAAIGGGDGSGSNWGPLALLGLGFVGGASVGLMGQVLCRNYGSSGRGWSNQEQELQEVTTQDGGQRNGDDNGPGVREQLLKSKHSGNGDKNKGAGGKHKSKKSQLSRIR